MTAPTRYSYGEKKVVHRGKVTNTSVGNANWDDMVEHIEDRFQYKIGYVPAGFEHRPDLISNLFYDTPAYWWLLQIVNNVTDPFEGFKVGDRIKLPIL